MSEKLYVIVREDYRNKKDIEDGKPFRVVHLGMNPDTLEHAKIILRKCMDRGSLSINKIVEAS